MIRVGTETFERIVILSNREMIGDWFKQWISWISASEWYFDGRI